MKKQLQAIKQELKTLAKQIKSQKAIRKPSHPAHKDHYIGVWRVNGLSEDFRHMHVAYCLARGRTLEQVDSGVNLNMDRVNWLLSNIQGKDRQDHKLYVIVSDDLTSSQQAVQAGHAVAEFLKKYPNTLWTNGHLIYLKNRPGWQGNMGLDWKLKLSGHEWAEFKEPDLQDKITAVAVFGPSASETLKNFRLL